jgi:hypothetical protein
MLFFQFVRRQTTLDYNYMAFPLYLHAFPCLAAGLRGRKASGVRERPVVAAIATAIVLAPLLFLLPSRLPQFMPTLVSAAGLGALPPIGAPLVLGLAGAAAMLLTPGRGRLLAFALWFSIVNAWIAPSPASYGIGTPGTRRQMLALFQDADRFTAALDPTLVGIKYWIAPERIAARTGEVSLASVFDSFVATRIWLTNLLARTSPGAPIDQLTTNVFERAPCIGLLSSLETHERLQHQMEARFEVLGSPLARIAHREFEAPDLSFALTVSRPEATLRDAGVPPCTP